MNNRQWNPFGAPDVPASPFETARCVVLPLCYEQAPSYGEGSRLGALHILEASSQLERLDEETLQDWGTIPIHTFAPLYPSGDPETAVSEMREAADRVLGAGKFLLSLGGDHAVSIGPIEAAARRHPGIGVLQIDAHLDLRDRWNGSRFNHACVMRRVVEDMGLSVVQVGIRAVAPEEREALIRHGLQPVYAHEVAGIDGQWLQRALSGLPEKVYVSMDLDGLDPSVLPGTGTPEPGGLSYRQVILLLQQVSRSRQVVAADITELAKIEGTQVSEYTAAKIAQKILLLCGSIL
jgi:agmatinase